MSPLLSLAIQVHGGLPVVTQLLSRKRAASLPPDGDSLTAASRVFRMAL